MRAILEATAIAAASLILINWIYSKWEHRNGEKYPACPTSMGPILSNVFP